MIQISGLTPAQVVLCETIWQMESIDAIIRFVSDLPEPKMREAYAMMNLMLAEWIDNQDIGDMVEANEVIKKVQSL